MFMAIVFFVVAMVAAILDSAGSPAASANIAQILLRHILAAVNRLTRHGSMNAGKSNYLSQLARTYLAVSKQPERPG